MENKRFLTAQDVMEMLDVSLSYCLLAVKGSKRKILTIKSIQKDGVDIENIEEKMLI